MLQHRGEHQPHLLYFLLGSRDIVSAQFIETVMEDLRLILCRSRNRNRNTDATPGSVDFVIDGYNVIQLYGFISQYEVDSSNINRRERQSVKENFS